jgi:hypothetical protein
MLIKGICYTAVPNSIICVESPDSLVNSQSPPRKISYAEWVIPFGIVVLTITATTATRPHSLSIDV